MVHIRYWVTELNRTDGPHMFASIGSVQSLSRVRLFVIPWTAALQASLSITNSWSLLKLMPKLMSLHQLCHPTISFSDALFSFCPQSFPALGTFPINRLFASGDQNTGVSALASVLPMSIQGGFPLRLTGLISLLSSRPSGVFSSITVRRHQFFGTLPSLQFPSHNPTWPPGGP